MPDARQTVRSIRPGEWPTMPAPQEPGGRFPFCLCRAEVFPGRLGLATYYRRSGVGASCSPTTGACGPDWTGPYDPSGYVETPTYPVAESQICTSLSTGSMRGSTRRGTSWTKESWRSTIESGNWSLDQSLLPSGFCLSSDHAVRMVGVLESSHGAASAVRATRLDRNCYGRRALPAASTNDVGIRDVFVCHSGSRDLQPAARVRAHATVRCTELR